MNEIYYVVTTYGVEPSYPSLGAKRWYYTTKEHVNELSSFYKDHHFVHGVYPLYSCDFRDAFLFSDKETAQEELDALQGLLSIEWEVKEIRIQME